MATQRTRRNRSARSFRFLVDQISWTNTIVTDLEATPPSQPRNFSRAVQLASADVLNEAATYCSKRACPHRAPRQGKRVHLRRRSTRWNAISERPHLSIYDGPSESTTSHSKKLITVFTLVARIPCPLTRSRPRGTSHRDERGARPYSRNVQGSSSTSRYRAGQAAHPLGKRPGRTSHLGRGSVWLHNSVRGALGLGLAVLVAEELSVEHTFWVILGTLSVLRSNALNTGQNALRAIEGTVAGFIFGAVLVLAFGTNAVLLWILLPFALFLAAFIPTAISFARGSGGLYGRADLPLQYPRAVRLARRACSRRGRCDRVRRQCLCVVLLWPRGAASEEDAARRCMRHI